MTITRIGKAHWEARGKRIKKAREWVDLIQGDVAEVLESVIDDRTYSYQIIHNIEKGGRDLRSDELTALAYLLDQSVEWLNCEPDATFNELAEARSPDIVRSLNTMRVPLSGRQTVDYRSIPTVRAHGTTDWDHRPIDVYADFGMLDAA